MTDRPHPHEHIESRTLTIYLTYLDIATISMLYWQCVTSATDNVQRVYLQNYSRADYGGVALPLIHAVVLWGLACKLGEDSHTAHEEWPDLVDLHRT